MNSLKDLIEYCHQRHDKPLRQRKTVARPVVYNLGYPCQYTIYCARNYPVRLNDIEGVDISFMPIGRAPEHDHGPRSFEGERFFERQGIRSWSMEHWDKSWGIQVYTGIPSERDGARWHDLDFKYEAICAAPDAVHACIAALVNAVENPLLTLEKSGGLRFSCRVPDYLHPNTDAERLYIYEHTPTAEDPHRTEVYLEILGDQGYNPWDARHEILLGNLLEPPVITQEILFGPIEALRAAIHKPAPTAVGRLEQRVPNAPQYLGSHKLDLAKEALLKRGFSYVREDNDRYYWISDAGSGGDGRVSLSEHNGTVWISTSIPHAELPTESTPITDVWTDTGILPPIPAKGVAVSDEVLAVREGNLSPLAIKRPAPLLQAQPGGTRKTYATPEENALQIQRTFNENVRIVRLIAGASLEKNSKIRSLLLNNAICLNVSNDRWSEAAEQGNPQTPTTPPLAHYKPRMYRWEQVKEIPVEIRMANPFQHGNVCEDPERCETLEEKGGDPRESICPHCQVYAECQNLGYLSQSFSLRRAAAQISEIPQLFFNPQYREVVKTLLEGVTETEEMESTSADGRADESEGFLSSGYGSVHRRMNEQNPRPSELFSNRLCILEPTKTEDLFLECRLPKCLLEEWANTYHGDALGSFAKALLNALEISRRTYTDVFKRVRTAVQTFEWREADIITQMCHVNVRGVVVRRGAIDPATGNELARFTVEFEEGTFAYIPVDDTAVEAFISNGLPYFQLSDFVVDAEMRIPMLMTEAINLGILNVETVENIQEFPTVCRNPNWTVWHQLRRFFAHYTQDKNAPMGWDDEGLRFWVPPVLHQSIKQLLLISTIDPERNFQNVFPNSDIEVLRTEPPTWIPGNQVFQIRAGVYPQDTMVDHDSNWVVSGMSKVAQHFFLGILTEIEKTPNVKHGIITHRTTLKQLRDVAAKENVCLLTNFRDIDGSEAAFEAADVLWIVGTPEVGFRAVWQRAQILFGNDEKPLLYERETESGTYTDQRLQSVYEEEVIYLLTRIIGVAGLDRFANKKVMLISGTELPNITHRPETLLFDWADFEVAGGLDTLAEVITTRQRFEVESTEFTAETSRQEIERILGCSSRQANRVLNKLRGGKVPRVPFREQIFEMLTDGEKKTAEFIAAINGNPHAIGNELKRLADAGEIVKVQRGVYTLP